MNEVNEKTEPKEVVKGNSDDFVKKAEAVDKKPVAKHIGKKPNKKPASKTENKSSSEKKKNLLRLKNHSLVHKLLKRNLV